MLRQVGTGVDDGGISGGAEEQVDQVSAPGEDLALVDVALSLISPASKSAGRAIRAMRPTRVMVPAFPS